jgi:hypothetical protein
MKVIVALCLLAVPTWLSGATKKIDPNVLRTFTSPDSSFEFRYLPILYRCQLDKETDDADEPLGTCSGQMTVCDDDDDSTLTFVCLGYPKMAAAFAVAEVKDARSKSVCLKGPDDWPMEIRGVRIIHGVRFRVFEVSSAWTGGGLNGELYRTFHANKCYELGIRAIRWSHSDDPDEDNEPRPIDNLSVQKRLSQALRSFRFLK